MSGLIGHQGILRELRALAASADPPHALLFAGPEGTGRTLLALEYAKLLNCERAAPTAGASLFGDALPPAAASIPCNECRPCRHINEGTHPDIITVAPGDTLPLMCFDVYGDPRYYLFVAGYNRLDGFRQLSVGQPILFPPLPQEVLAR